MIKLVSLFCTVLLSVGSVAWAAKDNPAKDTQGQMTQVQAAAPAASQPAGQGVFKTDKEALSYSLGMNIANNFQQGNVDIDLDVMLQAMKTILAGGKPLLTDEQARKAIEDWQQHKRVVFQKKQAELGEKNKKEGAAFLEENKKKEGVVTLPSGLQYQVISQGDGPSPKETDRVKVNHRGTLIDGTEFDSSAKSGKPAVFPVRGVNKGWTEALLLMKVGAKWKLFIPSELGYREQGMGRTVGPNAVLLLDVELVSIEPPATQPQRPAGMTPRTPSRPAPK